MRTITDPEEAREAFRPWREANARQAWKPVTVEGEGGATASRFGGRPALRPGEAWPACAVCGKPQVLFLQLDLDKLPPDAGDFGGGLLQFFYCLHCADDGGDEDANPWGPFGKSHLLRRLTDRDGVTVADPPPGAAPHADEDWGYKVPLPARHVVGWDAFIDGPDVQEGDELGLIDDFDRKRGLWWLSWPAEGIRFESKQGHFWEIVGGPLEGDKIGGWPAWVQSPERVDCPECGTRMRPVLQLASEDNLAYMFDDGGVGHVMQCPNHPDVLSFAWACG